MENKANQSLVNLAGAVDETVAKIDGTGERVKVRVLHISEFMALAAAMGDEVRQCELFCGKEPGWGKTLTNDTVVKVYELGHKLNDDFFVSWAQRRMKEQEKILPGIGARLLGFPSLMNGSPMSQSAAT